MTKTGALVVPLGGLVSFDPQVKDDLTDVVVSNEDVVQVKVDPTNPKLLAYSLGKLILGFYDEDDWSDLLQGKYIPPRRVKSYSLLQLLDRPARVRRPYTRRD